MQENPRILFFDGHCGLCNRLVNIFLKLDQNQRLKYSPLQGNSAAKLLPNNSNFSPETIVFIEEQQIYVESDAVIRSLISVGRGLQAARILYIIPKTARDWLYRKVAKNRYRIFGKNELCRVPTPSEKERFLP
jgi:predicted DCC family thiol-disulfide oxidoreductase YuxK